MDFDQYKYKKRFRTSGIQYPELPGINSKYEI